MWKKMLKNNNFIPGKTYIPVSGKIFDKEEIENVVKAANDGWWTEGKFAKQFESGFSKFLGVRHVSLVNSGSSANLLSFAALTSTAFGKRAIRTGDEIITVSASFPTTVNPIIQHGCIPVFIDVVLQTLNIDVKNLEKVINKKTRAIVLAHALGNPFPLKEILRLTKKYNLWLIEDCCDALGSKYDNKLLGSFGDIATFSFYPAHQITMGEGGAVITNNPFVHRAIRQFRDWGRDCWCDTGKDNTCKKRFGWKFDTLPYGYDHKYTYSQIGYNLKLTDFQAAIGVAQLKKLPAFIKKRKENFKNLYNFFNKHEEFFILPEWEKESDPCWFGFMIILKDNCPFGKIDIVNYLESKNIGTRGFFGGNLLNQPAYSSVKHKVIGDLKNSNKIMKDGFWIGVYPGITKEMITYIKKTFINFLKLYI